MVPIKKIIQALIVLLFLDIRIICSREKKRDLILSDPQQITHLCSHRDLHFHGTQNVQESFLMYTSWG